MRDEALSLDYGRRTEVNTGVTFEVHTCALLIVWGLKMYLFVSLLRVHQVAHVCMLRKSGQRHMPGNQLRRHSFHACGATSKYVNTA